jgi:hypothetical protein
LSTAPDGRKENILTSWKEIAAYLDRDVRTCVRWEKRYSLPVHRLERDSKAKVFAYKDEIDRWLAERSAAASSSEVPGPPAGSRPRLFPILFALAGLAAAAYFLFFRSPAGPGVPTDFHISGSKLLVVDDRARELWQSDMKLPDLETEGSYRGHFDLKRPGVDYIPSWPFLMFRDLNGDGRFETLFAVQTRSEIGEGTLVCFDDHGTELWRFDAGRALEFGGRPYHREYRIFGINVDDYDGDGAAEVLVISHHKPDWPCQVVLLDAAGRLEGEFWNAGYVMDASAGDLDGDGVKELVLGGVNNEYRRGCVAVFKPGELRGGSPQTGAAFRSPDIGAGGQAAYVLFPNTEAHRAVRQEGDPVNYFWIRAGDGLTAMTTDTQIYYDLDRDLACRNVILSTTFQNQYESLIQQGKGRDLPFPGEAYKKWLRTSLLHYRDGRWDVPPETDFSPLARDRRNSGSRLDPLR